jgi:DNA polymerase
MDDERTYGATYQPEQIGWIDFETHGSEDLKAAGAYRYATAADAIILAYAIGNGPVQVIEARGWPLSASCLPTDLLAHHAKVMNGTAVWAAWNVGFDKAIWNYATAGFPELEAHHVIDVMAQVAAAGLPPDLETAAKVCGAPFQKDKAGADLIKLFCLPDSKGTPLSHPIEWQQFIDYAGSDIEAMRSVFWHTRQLTRAEWHEYWAMERINERGIAIDMRMVGHAAKLAAEDKVNSSVELIQLTDKQVTTVDMVAKMTAWLLERLPPEGRAILTAREEEVGEDGELVKPAKHSLTRRQVERLIAYVKDVEIGHLKSAVLRVLQLRLYGGSKTPAKFGKMLKQQVDGVLYGQYVFNGAAQTGRASSRGVQIHNLARDFIKEEGDHIGALLDGLSYDAFEQLGEGEPVARKLSLLIRPSLVPSGNNVFVWSDWSQIEARITPWLAGVQSRLDIFREVDADPSKPDLYTRTAAAVSNVAIGDVTKAMRQRGKVMELALTFCGGKGALQSMAASYGMHLSDTEAQLAVDQWREVNPWAQNYSRLLWEAMREAMDTPDRYVPAGRIGFVYLPGYLGGTLHMRLPSGRLLTYRRIKWEHVAVKDDDGKITDYKLELTFARGYGRVKLWPGMFVENATQAVAADVLRGTLRKLVAMALDVRAHTHDEIILECPPQEADDVAGQLRSVMRRGFMWSHGLPLMSEETQAYYYTKDPEGHGL